MFFPATPTMWATLLENILAGLPAAILLCNEQQVITYANSLAIAYFGPSHATVKGRPLCDVLELAPELRSRLQRQLRSSSFLQGRRKLEVEVGPRILRYQLFRVTPASAILPQSGIMLWDVTSERQVVDRLIQAEKLTNLGTLVAGLAHEINNPSQAILGTAELLLNERDPDKIREYAQDITNYSKHIGKVVRDFSGYARSPYQDGRIEVNLQDRLTGAVQMVRRGPYFGGVEVVTAFEPIPVLHARKGEIDQLFVNLITNAAQAMNGKGLLTLATAMDADQATIHISDSGCGIPQSLVPRIFDPFVTTKDPDKGTGLGLSIVQEIITRYGGTITVKSQEGKGTTFTIRFPVDQA